MSKETLIQTQAVRKTYLANCFFYTYSLPTKLKKSSKSQEFLQL